MDFPCPIFQFFTKGQTCIPYPDFAPMDVVEIPRKDAGLNYGEVIRMTWKHCGARKGIVVLEHDIAVPLEAWVQLSELIGSFPEQVCAVPFILYPASTKGKGAYWANQRKRKDGSWEKTSSSELPPLLADTFGLGCTYLPPVLLAKMPEDLTHWGWPATDWRLSLLAYDEGISVHLTTCGAVHLHY